MVKVELDEKAWTICMLPADPFWNWKSDPPSAAQVNVTESLSANAVAPFRDLNFGVSGTDTVKLDIIPTDQEKHGTGLLINPP